METARSIEARGGAHSLPVLRNEGARDGDGAVVLHEGMEAGEFRKDAEEMVGNGGAGEIVDEPAELGVALHPLEEADESGSVRWCVKRELMTR